MKYLHVLLRASFALAAVLSAPFNHKARDVSQCTDGNKRTRMEWSSMADADRLSFVHAIRCLMDAPPSATVAKVTSRYDELVLIHSSLSDIVHQGPMFLPWHRYFVHGFEALLRDECGYKAPLPWWHEIKDSGNFGASSMFTGEYFGSLPENTAPADQQTMDICVTDGGFANRTAVAGMPEPHCLSRAESKDISKMVTQQKLDSCHVNVTSYEDHAVCVGNGIHVATHAAIGRTLGYIPGSVNDPVFFMHHSFIDWEWMRWQREDEKRWEAVFGCVEIGDECTPATLDTMLPSGGLFPDMSLRDVASPARGPLCYEYDFY